jgi:hypothetical protein
MPHIHHFRFILYLSIPSQVCLGSTIIANQKLHFLFDLLTMEIGTLDKVLLLFVTYTPSSHPRGFNLGRASLHGSHGPFVHSLS